MTIVDEPDGLDAMIAAAAPAVTVLDGDADSIRDALIADSRDAVVHRQRLTAAAISGGSVLALAACAVAVAQGWTLGTDSSGDVMWSGPVPSGVICTASLVVADAEGTSVTDADLDPYREALQEIGSEGLEIPDYYTELAAQSQNAYPWGFTRIDDTPIGTPLEEGVSYVYGQVGEGRWVRMTSQEASDRALPLLTFESDEFYLWVTDESVDSGVAVIEMDDEQFTQYVAIDRLGSADITRDDVLFLTGMSRLLERDVNVELHSRGLGALNFHDDESVYDPVTIDPWSWTCG